MNRTEVTEQGLEHVRPGREALTGAVGQTATGPPRRKGGGGERPMVPDAELTSYYGKPIINEPVWESPDIPGYLFAGGLAGAASLLAAGASLTDRLGLARSAKVGALAALSLGGIGLIHDLGRPSRFYNMLRVIKPTSPMSVGTWILSFYGPAAAAAAGSDITGWFPRIGRAATFASAAAGPLLASYTAALISNTAVPAWHNGYREMPFVFVSSGATAAAGLGLLAAPLCENKPARHLALMGAAVELSAAKLMEKRMGMVAEPYHQGFAGRCMKAGQVLTAGGVLGTVVGGRRNRLVAGLSGVALMASSAFTRWGIFHAGLQSAKDPKYTVVPQRQRLEQRAREASSEALTDPAS